MHPEQRILAAIPFMSDKIFVDTNVLVYCRDAGKPEKQDRAMAWIAHLWKSRTGRISVQVFQEYYSIVTTKLKPGMDPLNAREDVESLFAWRPISVNAAVIRGAWNIQDRYRLSWWDSLIVSAALIDNCDFLLTEDLQRNQKFENLRVINPFDYTPESLLSQR